MFNLTFCQFDLEQIFKAKFMERKEHKARAGLHKQPRLQMFFVFFPGLIEASCVSADAAHVQPAPRLSLLSALLFSC